ncbi:MAG: hypothetical protein R3330_14890, partial [Saprospiraceae bacterium]|nr:hypothetical protein [Saprospiraceae bacterium]
EVPSGMSAVNHSNTAVTTNLASGINDSVTSLTVDDATGYPNAPFHIRIESEVIYVGARAGTTFSSLIRGYDGTTAAAHTTTPDVDHVVVAADFQQAGAVSNLLGEVVLTSSSSYIEIPNIPGGYKDLRIVAVLRSDNAATSDGPAIQVGNGSIDTGNNYRNYRIYDGTSEGNDHYDTVDTWDLAGGVPAASVASGLFGVIDGVLANYASTSQFRHFSAAVRHIRDSGTYFSMDYFGLWENSADAIDVIRITPINGSNWVAGSYVRIYGEPSGASQVEDWTAFTPDLQSTGTNPTVGNGTLTGKYRRIGTAVEVWIEFAFGTTSTAGTGDWYFDGASLPYPNSGDAHYGSMYSVDSGSYYFSGQAVMSGGSGDIYGMGPDETGVPHRVGATQPWVSGAPANGDHFGVQITYEADLS